MNRLQFVLLADGTSDRALLPIVRWVLQEQLPAFAIQEEWADLSLLRPKPAGLAQRLRAASALYRGDVLFVHRDAEGVERTVREDEIMRWMPHAEGQPMIPIVPVRMTEAWLLFDEKALRDAAGNPYGENPLDLPKITKLESLPDPKQRLHDALREASGLNRRRRAQFRTHEAIHNLANRIVSFAPLRQLDAFRALESRLESSLPEILAYSARRKSRPSA